MQSLYSHLKKLELEQKNRPNPHMRRQLIKIGGEINELETRNTVEQINETRTQSQGKIWKKLTHLETKNHPAQE